ncbi:hypothetical protein [Micromonospora sp. RL09-050-HVF-A]|uniref:hypothetical protein n=1 Tax=Micromonospora sp. RL09-050-HVF-A TaxID=1703433 RepID=UPI001C5EEE6A|nr:hypothetical protein [Micromonospora sp. RL09-050-HVF-A]MBW4700601.1 hypothetical protein [Micromonospora sp. RL09-050-HVF-A]
MTSAPREAESRIGPVGALLCRLFFVAICLPGTVLLAADVTGPSIRDSCPAGS